MGHFPDARNTRQRSDIQEPTNVSLFTLLVYCLLSYATSKLRALWLGAVKQATKVTVYKVCFRKVKDTEI